MPWKWDLTSVQHTTAPADGGIKFELCRDSYKKQKAENEILKHERKCGIDSENGSQREREKTQEAKTVKRI